MADVEVKGAEILAGRCQYGGCVMQVWFHCHMALEHWLMAYIVMAYIVMGYIVMALKHSVMVYIQSGRVK